MRTRPAPAQFDDGVWASENRARKRFAFGRNWAAFLEVLNDERIRSAEESLSRMLATDRLDAKTFVDIGSGSGLFSLAAHRLGAKVTSFDFDPHSVACTAEVRRRYCPDDANWTVKQGSVLDEVFLRSLGTFDVVYSWGVLHHTGSMWHALENAASLVRPSGELYIAIYNDQGRASQRWSWVKRTYMRAPGPLKSLVLMPALLRLWGPTIVRDTLRGRPLKSWKTYALQPGARGMHPWRDLVDWVGGYPFEVAKPEDIIAFCAERGFVTKATKICGTGLGCNEFVLEKLCANT